MGLGNFFRAHQAWYTEHAADAADWGYAAFTGRNPRLAQALSEQGSAYTLITRAAEGDEYELIDALSAVHPAGDQEALAACFRQPDLALVTLTVTEAGYHATQSGCLDVTRPEVAADLEALRADLTAPVRTAPAKLVVGLAARQRAGAGPLALVPCDNLLSNGALTRRVVGELAALVDDGWPPGSTNRSASSPPWSTASRRRPRKPTSSRYCGAPAAPTGVRSPPSHSPNGL